MEIHKKIVIKILIAFVVGVVIGLNRERSGKVAGMRTQMLVCLGSALLAGISIHLKDFYAQPESVVRLDPARLMAQIVTGIGFLGAGVILKSKQRVIGVTTAATIWATAAIGIAIGAGFYLPALTSAALVLLLDPIAHLQFTYGLKADTYLLKVNKRKEREVAKILGRLKIEEKRREVKRNTAYLTILSSTQRNRELHSHLDEKKIEFDIEQSEEEA